jgi:hypothetical protein
MASKILVAVGGLLIVLAIVLMISNNQPTTIHSHDAHEVVASENTPLPPSVPAYQGPEAVHNLRATLSPVEFFGKAREAYAAAKEIPQTLAQLPCYCHCDKGFGHKSLHTCFEDDHASHCAVCVDEALLAYKLQKQDRLTPEQIRQTIIAKYSAE